MFIPGLPLSLAQSVQQTLTRRKSWQIIWSRTGQLKIHVRTAERRSRLRQAEK